MVLPHFFTPPNVNFRTGDMLESIQQLIRYRCIDSTVDLVTIVDGNGKIYMIAYEGGGALHA